MNGSRKLPENEDQWTKAEKELAFAFFALYESCSEITKYLVRELMGRDKLGKAKYGTSLDRTDLTREQWLDHMTEELLDAAGYAQSAKRTAASNSTEAK